MAAALVSACATQRWRNELPSASPLATQIHESLNQTVISQVEIQNLTLEKAMKTWQKLIDDLPSDPAAATAKHKLAGTAHGGPQKNP